MVSPHGQDPSPQKDNVSDSHKLEAYLVNIFKLMRKSFYTLAWK